MSATAVVDLHRDEQGSVAEDLAQYKLLANLSDMILFKVIFLITRTKQEKCESHHNKGTHNSTYVYTCPLVKPSTDSYSSRNMCSKYSTPHCVICSSLVFSSSLKYSATTRSPSSISSPPLASSCFTSAVVGESPLYRIKRDTQPAQDQ